MEIVHFITSLLVLCGACFMMAAIIQGRNAKEGIPPDLKGRWRIMLTLMAFFLVGYLLYSFLLISRYALSDELIIGPVFFGGALFVLVVIRLSREAIGKARSAEGELRLLNESLERHVAERTQELEQSHHFLKTVLDSINDRVSIIDVNDFRIVGANAAFLREYGEKEADVIGRCCYEVTHNRQEICAPPDDICPMTETLTSGVQVRVEHLHHVPNGESIHEEVVTTPVRNKDGSITGVVHVSRDVTMWKRAEEALRAGNEELEHLIDSIHAGIMIINPLNHLIVDVNAFAARMIGTEKEGIIGKVCHRFVCAAEEGRCPITDLKEGVDNSERALITIDGRRVPILKSVVPVRYQGELHLVESFIDITHHKEFEEQMVELNQKLIRSNEELQEINEELKNFAYIVSHDMRAPLVNIKGFAGELKMALNEIDTKLNDVISHIAEQDRERIAAIFQLDVPEALDFINSSINRMDALITSILKLSRLGRQALKVEPIDMTSLVGTILKTLTHQFEQKRASAVVEPLPEITADRTAIEQIFGNLLDNAVKYLEPSRPGRIDIRAEHDLHWTTFQIADNGRGIAQEDMGKVFEIFRRAGRQDVQGDGMGLAYVKTLVRRLGGRIWCESKLGVGTTFSFTIPVVPTAPGVEQ